MIVLQSPQKRYQDTPLFSEPCTAYPSTWQHVKFPGETPSGDLVTVACTDSRVNKGSEEVTCKTGQQWTSDVTPECVYRE